MIPQKSKKTLLAVLVLAVSACLAFADRIYYSYDNTGNRVSASTHAPSTRGAFDNGTDISDTLALSGIRVYPNPTEGPLTVVITGYDLENAGITVTDMTGKNLIRLTETAETNELDLTDYPSGIYLVRIRTVESESVHKIVRK
ncbi:MAG: T9SS type A sorting domain-containing protein [Bacteroidaceae bacterium]|nr:T9SS type A sorting domain-containing protein [Bacteroidaceae bacterium]